MREERRGPERRRASFLEKLSLMLIVFSSIGAFLVLLDPVITWTFGNGNTIQIGGKGFADQLKGGVVMLMIVGGFTGLVAFWFPGSAAGTRQADAVSRIAEATAPAAAAAVVAAAVQSAQAQGDVNVNGKDTP